MHHPIQESADRPGITRPRSGSPFLHVLVSCIRRVRSRRARASRGSSGFTALMDVPRGGWTASSWAMPSRGPTNPRDVRGCCASTRGPLSWPGIFSLAGRHADASGGRVSTWRRSPCGATWSGPRWPPYRRSPPGRNRREATPICRLRSPGKLAVPGLGLIVSASRRTASLAALLGGGSRGPVAGSCGQKGSLYDCLDGRSGPASAAPSCWSPDHINVSLAAATGGGRA